MNLKKNFIIILNIIIFLIVIAFFALPDLWMIFASLEKGATLNTVLPTPMNFTLTNYTNIFKSLITPLANSLYICGLGTLVAIIISGIAAYPLSRYRFKLKAPIMYGMLFLSVLPITAMMIPAYSMFVTLNILDSRWATSLFMAATSIPVNVWILKSFFDTISIELEEAAWVDGATRFQSLFHVVMPLSIPGFAVAALLSFVGQWGNFYVPFVLLSDSNKFPLAVSIYNFFTSRGLPDFGQLAAYSLIYTVVPLVIYFLASKSLTAGLNIGGLKG
jgi:multiple sugar transport system permease protein|uniref:Carbohydrate ABC transporter permease n=1 Tax=Thermodesulfobium narugense TaxID=184064 RepID=A0A7C5KF75_9BACT